MRRPRDDGSVARRRAPVAALQVVRDAHETDAGRRLQRTRDRLRSARRRAVFGLVALTLLGLLTALIADYLDLLDPGPPPLTVVRVIDGPGVGEKPTFVRPLAAAWGLGGTILVSDTGNGRICEFARDGRFLREFGGRDTTAAAKAAVEPLQMPVGLDVSGQGVVYVADLRGGRVAMYDPAGRFMHTFAPPGATDWRPTDVAVGERDVYVTDETGVEVFTLNGGSRGRLEIEGDTSALARPNGVAVGLDGTIYVSDTNRFRVLALDASGTVLWKTAGGDAGARLFGLPRGIVALEDGGVLVADAFAFSLRELDANGSFVREWGAQGAQPGRFQYPNDVDAAGDLVVVADKENHRVQVLRLRRGLGAR